MKKITISKIALMAAFLSLGTLQSFAQTTPRTFSARNPANGLVRCATNEYEEYLQEKNPNLAAERAGFETWIAGKIADRKALREMSTNSTNAVITIPVVVHIIHNGDNVGSGENIKEGQILSQITVLNQDYRKEAGTPGDNEFEAGADTEIQFCLAQVDPNGNATTGIDRVDMGQATWDTMDDIDSNLKPNTQWDPTQYFNIWVVRFGNASSETGTLLGYAQFPSSSQLAGIDTNGGSASSDGVVIGYEYFGSSAIFAGGTYQAPYNRGRTATHEIGHCLGLRHINGDNSSCVVNASDSNNDYCPDTPAQKELHYNCEEGSDTCSSEGLDMVENYMDYSNDTCMRVFTQDQKERMVTVLTNSPRRKTLGASTKCQATVGAEQFNLLNGINLYPNPTQGVLNIATNDSDLPDSYTVYNSLGQTITTVTVKGSANLTVDTSAYSNGVYFIKLDKGNASKTLKFIKN